MPIHRPRFRRAIDSQFEHLGRPGEYLAKSRDADAAADADLDNKPLNILVIARRPEELFELGESQIHGELPQLEFRKSEVQSPRRGDVIRLGHKAYRFEAEPALERHQMVWVVAALSEAALSETA